MWISIARYLSPGRVGTPRFTSFIKKKQRRKKTYYFTVQTNPVINVWQILHNYCDWGLTHSTNDEAKKLGKTLTRSYCVRNTRSWSFSLTFSVTSSLMVLRSWSILVFRPAIQNNNNSNDACVHACLCLCVYVRQRHRTQGSERVRKVMCLCLRLLSITVNVWRPHFPSGTKNFLTWLDLTWLDLIIIITMGTYNVP